MFISIDVGGTNTKLAISKDLKKITEFEKFFTPKEGIEKIIFKLNKKIKAKKVKGVIIGLAGVLDQKKEKLLKSPHLPAWENKSLAKIISRKLKTKVFLENDADLAGLGEAVFGAGKNKKIVAYLTIGTGVGGTRIVEKKIGRFFQGFEPGHQIIMPGGKKCFCGQNGCLDIYAGSKGFFQRYNEKPEFCKNLKIWQDYSNYLSFGIINLIVFWSPEIIILGGSFIKSGKMFFPYLKKFIKKNLKIVKMPPIVKAKLGDKSALLGGFYYLKEKLKL